MKNNELEVLRDGEKQAIIDYMLAVTNLGLKKYFGLEVEPDEVPVQENYAIQCGIAKSTFANKLNVSNVKNLGYQDFISEVIFENRKLRKQRNSSYVHHTKDEQMKYVMEFSVEKKKNPKLTIKAFAERIGIKRNTFDNWYYKYGEQTDDFFWSQCNTKCEILAKAIKDIA